MGKEIDFFFDLETTARGPKNNPEAQYKDNEVVMAGWSFDGGKVYTGTLNAMLQQLKRLTDKGHLLKLIAHNLKFDLKYLLRQWPRWNWAQYEYYCTMTAQYRISGHHNKFTSLEDLCDLHYIRYKKSLDLGALIAAGIDVMDVDEDDLRKYLIDDVDYLMSAYYKQYLNCMSDEWDMDYILPLARMELHGLPLDMDKAKILASSLSTIKATAIANIESMLNKKLQFEDGRPVTGSDYKALAPRTMSYYLTGYPNHGCGAGAKGPVKNRIVFKPGEGPILGREYIQKLWGCSTPSNLNLGFPINTSVMDELVHISVMAEYKTAKDNNKLLNTYLYPFLQEASVTGGTVHPKLNTCSTNTGRLSSSNPNGQNIPPSMRNLFKSTLGEMYEIDFSQLEMVGAATLSEDVTMIDDILNGRDIHFETGKEVFGWKAPSDMTKDTRRTVKAVNFGVLYGGGYKGIAESAGVDKDLVKKLVASFYARYPRVKQWQEEVLEDVQENSFVTGTRQGESYRGSNYKLHTKYGGRTFYFEETESPAWLKAKEGRSYSFKPTETKNYPIQGFAGGDIVMKALTILDDVLEETHALLRMTVHDSIVLDWVEGKENDLAQIMTKICKIVQINLGIPVPLKFDIEHNTYWL